MKKVLTLGLVFCTVAACAQWGKRIKGNGNVVTIERSVGDYDQVAVAGWFDVELVDGNEGELTPCEGELTETDGRLLRWPACTSRLAGLHPEPLGRLLRGGGVLQDVREALVWASSLRGRACRGTGGLSVPRLVCPASNLLMRSAMDGDTALAGKKRRAASVGSADASPRSEVRRRGTWKTAVVPEPSASRPGCVCVWVCC